MPHPDLTANRRFDTIGHPKLQAAHIEVMRQPIPVIPYCA